MSRTITTVERSGNVFQLIRRPIPSEEPLFPENVAASFKRLITPMKVTASCEYCIRACGTVSDARSARILEGRPLPGDPGANKTQYFFRLADGRKISVWTRPATKKHAETVWVNIWPTNSEARQIRDQQKRLSVKGKTAASNVVNKLREDVRISLQLAKEQREKLAWSLPQLASEARNRASNLLQFHEDVARKARAELKALGYQA